MMMGSQHEEGEDVLDGPEPLISKHVNTLSPLWRNSQESEADDRDEDAKVQGVENTCHHEFEPSSTQTSRETQSSMSNRTTSIHGPTCSTG